MAAFNGLFLCANGLFMLVAPQVWYDFVPGLTDTGFYNQHFIRDIGLIQLSQAEPENKGRNPGRLIVDGSSTHLRLIKRHRLPTTMAARPRGRVR